MSTADSSVTKNAYIGINDCIQSQTVHKLEDLVGPESEVLSVPHRFLPDSGDSSGIRCIPEEWKLAGGSAKSAIPVIFCSSGILAFQN